MNHNTPSEQPSAQSGFTLIELLIALFILGLIAAVVVPNFSGDSTKGKVLSSTLQEMGNALVRMKLDTGCYPTRLDGLFVQGVNTASNSFCGQDMTASWQGPYTKPFPVDANGDALLQTIGSNVTAQIASQPGGIGTEYIITAQNVPNAVIHEAVSACNGSDNIGTATFDNSKCVGTPGTGTTPTGTFSVLVDETK